MPRQTTHQLRPVPPFDFAQTLRFLGMFMPTNREQTLSVQSLTKAVRIQGQTVGFSLHFTGTVEAPELTCNLFSDQPLTPGVEETALSRVRFFLSLDENLTAFYALARQDPPFQNVLRQWYGYHQVKFLTPFENACWAVLTQRTPGNVARQLKWRLVKTYGGSVQTLDGALWAFPEPADLAGASASELAALLGHSRKGDAVTAAVQAFAQVDEAWLRQGPYDEVEAWLRSIHGIGPWSATFVLLRGLGRMERLALDDPDSALTREMMKAATQVYGPLSFEALAERARHYGVWQGYWGHYLRAAG